MNFNGAKFNKNEIQEHYDRFFLDSSDLNPLINSQIIGRQKETITREAKRFKKFSDYRYEKKSLLDLKSDQSIPITKKPPALKNNILGYNAKRKCFYYDL